MIKKYLPKIKTILFCIFITCSSVVTYKQQKAIKYAEVTDDMEGFFYMYFSDANSILLKIGSIAAGLYILLFLPSIIKTFKSFLGMGKNEQS